MDAEARFNGSEAVVTADLGEQERDELMPAGVIFGVSVALVLLFDRFEFISRKIPEQLSQNRRNLLHGLKLLVNAAFIDGLVSFNIAVFPSFSGLLYFFTGHEHNNKEATINWRFTTTDSRIKLKHLYTAIYP
jgi:hypothetical protein